MKKQKNEKRERKGVENNKSSDYDPSSSLDTDSRVLWGKQTQLSLKYFNIGKQGFEKEFIHVLVMIKRASADVNYQLGILTSAYHQGILSACDEILFGGYAEQFPLKIWQTGSGTQTNMNVNEVIASLAGQYLKEEGQIHPNDHVNLSQSSNDVFPTAMHIVVAVQTRKKILPAIEKFETELLRKEVEFNSSYTVARTHLMDALPIQAGAVLSAYLSQLAGVKDAIIASLQTVYQLALGGTAVGSGANAPALFGKQAIELLAEHYQLPFSQNANLYAGVSAEDILLRFSATLKQLAATLFKIANDFRLLGSGPRCGFNEWHLPANEPGSSIMPGKVNPTQCEALSMVCLQVFGNDLTVSLAASSSQLQLNTYRPVIIHNVLESIELLTDSMNSFAENCIHGLTLNYQQAAENMNNNLSVITLLVPEMGYDMAAKIAHQAQQDNISLAAAAESLGAYNQEQFSKLLQRQLNRHFSVAKNN